MAAMFRLLADDTRSNFASVQLVTRTATVLHAALHASAVNDGGDVLRSVVLPVCGYRDENRVSKPKIFPNKFKEALMLPMAA